MPDDARTRSRLTNHKAVLPDVDGRTALAKRYRAIVTAIARDQGGAEQLSESRAQLVRRFAAAACLAEQMEGRLVRGQQIDLAEHATLCSTLVRLSGRIGIDRVPKDIAATHAWAGATREIVDESIAYGHLDEHGRVVVDGVKDPLA